MARDLGVSGSDIWLGARANEGEIKRLSESGQLASYRIVHFATHGALAGELKVGAEPGLILTPPGEATPEDDGYLSASEIAGLKLDAEWVILSACNTAAGEDLRHTPLIDRRLQFTELLARSSVRCLHLVWGFDDGAKLLQAAERQGLEGIVSKRQTSAYRSGPSRDWVKIKTAAWRAANRERWRMFEKR